MSSLLNHVSMSGWFDQALKSAAVLLLAMVVAAALGRASAAWRHLVWCLSVVCLLLLPVLALALPDWRVAWLPQWTAETLTAELRTAKRAPLAEARQADLASADCTEPLDDAALALTPSATALESKSHQEPHSRPLATIETANPPRAAMPWLAITWTAGGLLSLVPLAIGLGQLAGLHRRSQIIGDRRWLALLDELRRQLAVRRGVQLRQCQSALAPLTWGALRPVLLVPSEADAWPDERRRLVLLHELAHIRRWDWLTQLLAHVACALYWFNPLIWWAARQMRIERERACDDIVLVSGARASDYARELLAVATGFSHSHVSVLATVPMAGRYVLNDRLLGILDSGRSRAALTRTAVCLGAALAAATIAPLAMLRAAPPESTESEIETRAGRESVTQAASPESTESATAEPKKEPPAEPIRDLGSAERQVEEIDDDHEPLTLRDPEGNDLWDLSLEEAVGTALANSKVLRNLGGVLLTPVEPQSSLEHAHSRRKLILSRVALPVKPQSKLNHAAKVAAEDSKAVRGEKVRFILARTKDDIAAADIEAGLRNTLSDVERAYWDLYYNYRNLNAVQTGRDSALATWRKVHALYLTGGKGGDAEAEAQAREQYFLFRAQVENTLNLLYTAEGRLRYMMGLTPTDGRLIRPADDPTTEFVHFDWKEILPETLNSSVDLRRQRAVIKQNELKLAQARLAMSGVRDAELTVAESKARLEDEELELKHKLTNALRDLDRNYHVSRTTFNRRASANRQVEAVKVKYDAGAAMVDMLLDAQRRLADAEIAYYRALVDYNLAILQVHYRKGSLLQRNGILLAEGNWAGAEAHKK
jgi:beta-lactamase regulating signal transducer with metallopeptidase domain